MIKSELIKKEVVFGFHGKVELHPNVEDCSLQLMQFQLELVSIYEALASRYSFDDATEVITESVGMFLEAHKSS